jgi:hypothetical protein
MIVIILSMMGGAAVAGALKILKAGYQYNNISIA